MFLSAQFDDCLAQRCSVADEELPEWYITLLTAGENAYPQKIYRSRLLCLYSKCLTI